MEECVALVMAELQRRGVANAHTLAYQSRVGPVEWLKPYTDDSIRWAAAYRGRERQSVREWQSVGTGSCGGLRRPRRSPTRPRSRPLPRRELAQQGVGSLLAVPISFVSEHIETLEEIDCEYRCV